MNRRNFLGKGALAGVIATGSISPLLAKADRGRIDYKRYKVAADVDVLVCGGGPFSMTGSLRTGISLTRMKPIGLNLKGCASFGSKCSGRRE